MEMWKTLGRPLLAPNHVRRSFFGLFLGVGSWVPKVAFWAFFGRFWGLWLLAGPLAVAASVSGSAGLTFGGLVVFLVWGRGWHVFALLATLWRGFGRRVGPCFWLLSSSVRVRLTFRPFVVWFVSSCRSRILQSCPMGGVLWFVGSRGSCRPGFVLVGRSAVRLPASVRPFRATVPCRLPGSWWLPALPGFGPWWASMCDFGFWALVRFLVRPGGLAPFLGLPVRSAFPTPVAPLLGSGFLVGSVRGGSWLGLSALVRPRFRPLSGSFPRRLAGGSWWPRFLVPAPALLALHRPEC